VPLFMVAVEKPLRPWCIRANVQDGVDGGVKDRRPIGLSSAMDGRSRGSDPIIARAAAPWISARVIA
jgi:hypothetical protein